MDEIKIYVRELGLGINIYYPEIRCSMKVMGRVKLSMRMIMMELLGGATDNQDILFTISNHIIRTKRPNSDSISKLSLKFMMD
jgi:hypothetical protein